MTLLVHQMKPAFVRSCLNLSQYDLGPYNLYLQGTSSPYPAPLLTLAPVTFTNPGQSCSAVEYVQGEDDIPVSVDMGENWDANFIAELGEEEASAEAGEDEEKGEMPMDEEPVPKIKKFRPLLVLDEVKFFLENHGCFQEATSVSSVVDMVACAHVRATKQATLMDYLSPAATSSS